MKTEHKQRVQAHMFWATGKLGRFEHLAVNSFIKQGYDLTLWSYEKLGNVPQGVTLGRAHEIIPQSKMFLVKNSLAPFADIFRLKLLTTHGGLWADADVIAVKPAHELPRTPFLVTEDIWQGSWRKDKPWTITNCIINNPLPQPGNLIDVVHAAAHVFPPHKITWSTIGPDLLHNMADIYPEHGYDIMEPSFACHYPAGDIVSKMLSDNPIPTNSHFIHLYNDMWRRDSNIDKNTIDIPQGSLLDKLIEEYD